MYGRSFAERINTTYFDGRLAPGVLDRLSTLPTERDDARAFVERFCRTMRAGGFTAADVSSIQADVLSSLIFRLLPGNWEGRVPPITVAGRHIMLDRLVAQIATEDALPHAFIDVACGFPPLTTVDTATALSDWQVIGVDRALPAYLVNDASDNYAVFDAGGRATYFQPRIPSVEAWTALLSDWEGTRRRFESLLQLLLDERARLGSPDRVETGDASLDVDPARLYSHDRLRFVAADLDDARLPAAGVVRCCNMLMYFDRTFRSAALTRLSALLAPDGLLVCGTDWIQTTEARYFTYRKRDGGLADGEFAFSLDNLAPLGIIPWYTLHDDDVEIEMLTGLVGLLRADRRFIGDFMDASDAIRAELRLAPRGPDGYYEATLPTGSPAELWSAAAQHSERLSDSFAAKAVAALTNQGFEARVNGVGHVAVRVPVA